MRNFCHEVMVEGLFTYGGLLAGFVSSNPLHCRPHDVALSNESSEWEFSDACLNGSMWLGSVGFVWTFQAYYCVPHA